MGNRSITLLPSHLVEGSVIRYGVSNAKQVTETEELILAYRKDVGRDKRIRFMVGRVVRGELRLMPYFLHNKEPLTKPENLKAGNFIWGLSRPFRTWLAAEAEAGNLTEGKSYTFKKRYKITLLDPKEMDILSESLIEYGKYDTDYSFEY